MPTQRRAAKIHHANQLPVPYDFCVCILISHLLTISFNSVFNVKVLVGAFNQEKVLVGAGFLSDCENIAD